MYSGDLRKQQNNQNFLYTHKYQQEWMGSWTTVRETQEKEVMGHFWVLNLDRYRGTVARVERLGRRKKECGD